MWLKGPAGCGKSTVANSVAEYFRRLRRRGAFLFFERGKSDPADMFRTLAHQLALFDGNIQTAVLDVLAQEIDIANAPYQRQFDMLLYNLLCETDLERGPIIIVIDALDECGTSASRRELLQILSRKFQNLPSMFRFLITSRPDADVASAFTSEKHIASIEINIENNLESGDMLSYFQKELKNIKENAKYEYFPEIWPSDTEMRSLVKISGGLFIWASTVIRLVSQSVDKCDLLEDLISPSSNHSLTADLDQLYSKALALALPQAEARVSFVAIMGLILTSVEPLCDLDINTLLRLPVKKPSQHILGRLRSLLDFEIGKPIHIFHASFSDYLTTAERCGEWYINLVEQHNNITKCCFQTMEIELRFNICDLKTSYLKNMEVIGMDDMVKSSVSHPLSYACQFWSQHLQSAQPTDHIIPKLEQFLSKSLLLWIETCSLLGSPTSKSILQALRWCTVRAYESNVCIRLTLT
jgi:hypothetical protein